MKLEIPEFKTKKELFDFLVENKSTLIAQKKAELKHADAISYLSPMIDKGNGASKANEPFTPEGDEFKVKVIINTTNLMDSHLDVHIPGLWGKSLKENKDIMHIREHKMSFSHIISNGADLKAFTKTFSFSELGFDFEGDTEALVFESNIKRERNEFMFDQYSKGYVKQHSVGMRYVKLVMCINNESYGAEFEAWEKYFPMVANKEMAEDKGYFWAVKEAKVIEGSAVPLGSNFVTPTLENNTKSQPSKDTDNNQPEQSTDKAQEIKELLNQLKSI